MNVNTNDPFHEPNKLSRFQRFLINHSGIGIELFRAYGTTTDISALCNRATAQFATFLYGAVTMAVASQSDFGTAGSINLTPIAAAFSLAYLLFIRMDAFVNLRGLYASGKRELRKMGLKLRFGGDDVAWWCLLFAKGSVGIPAAVIAGTLSSQIFFANEIRSDLAGQVAPRNAPIVAVHTAEIDNRVRAAADQKSRDAADAAAIKTELEALRRQDVLNTTRGARRTARQQAQSETARERTTSALGAYESKSVSAEAKAKVSAEAYAGILATRNSDLRVLIESDPRFVAPPHGLLAGLLALHALAERDGFVAAGILLVDFVGISLELWILVLAIAQCPTRLSVNLYRDYLRSTAAVARALATEIKPPDSDPPDGCRRPTARTSPASWQATEASAPCQEGGRRCLTIKPTKPA
jgi:hypothetical protein